jgi:hypothetical protein
MSSYCLKNSISKNVTRFIRLAPPGGMGDSVPNLFLITLLTVAHRTYRPVYSGKPAGTARRKCVSAAY